MPKPQNDTRSALVAIKGEKSQRATCAALCLDDSWRGTIHRILHRFDVSMDKENEVRRRLGLPPIAPPQIPVTPCPSCAARGIVRSHGDKLDCNGNGGPAVVLADGQRVTTPRGPWQSKAKPEVAAMVRGLQLCLERKQLAGQAGAKVREV